MENIIIDTDLGFDCDDGGVLVLANKLHKLKKVNILAVTHCVNKTEGGIAIKKINEFYGNENIPVAISSDYSFDVDYLYEEFFEKMNYHDDFEGFDEKPTFYKLLNVAFPSDCLKKETTFISSEQLIKETLLQAEDNSVVLLCVGQLNTFAKATTKFKDLFNCKVKKAVVMCGNFQQTGEYFDDGETYWPGEFNVIMDIESAKTVLNDTDFPIDIIDYNQGVNVLTGDGLKNQTENPVYKMYKKHGKGKECSSWDPIAFLCATGEYEDFFEYSKEGKVLVEEKGKTIFKEGDGKHRLVFVRSEKRQQLRDTINEIFSKDI